MRIFRFNELQQTPWKNGGGITREIALVRAGDALVWRLSIADVGADGPFSKFEGLHRILTVIEGHGMELISPAATLQPDYAVPVSFDGAWEIQSRLKNGPLRDFNLIYNPLVCTAKASVISAAQKRFIDVKPGQLTVLHCISGSLALGETALLKGDTALIENKALHAVIAENSAVLVIVIQADAKS